MSAIDIVELQVGDAPAAWRAAGFAVDDDGVARIGTARVRCVPGSGRGVLRWTLRGGHDGAGGDSAHDFTVDGLPTTIVDEPLAVPGVHTNGSTIIDHLVIATPDIDRTVAAIRALGPEPRRERLAGSGPRALRQVFLRAGEVILEVVGPPERPDDPVRAGAPATFFGLACTVENLDECARRLGDRLGAVRDAVQPGRRIATLRHDAVGVSVPVAFMSA